MHVLWSAPFFKTSSAVPRLPCKFLCKRSPPLRSQQEGLEGPPEARPVVLFKIIQARVAHLFGSQNLGPEGPHICAPTYKLFRCMQWKAIALLPLVVGQILILSWHGNRCVRLCERMVNACPCAVRTYICIMRGPCIVLQHAERYETLLLVVCAWTALGI